MKGAIRESEVKEDIVSFVKTEALEKKGLRNNGIATINFNDTLHGILNVFEILLKSTTDNINEIEVSFKNSMLNTDRETGKREATKENKASDSISEVINKIDDSKRGQSRISNAEWTRSCHSAEENKELFVLIIL